MGVSIIASSGDDGAFSRDLRTNSAACTYSPQFPASSPYVTAVGATFGPESGTFERACQADLGGVITSGGGFSTNAPRPFWQDTAIAAYLNSNSPNGAYNAGGRGIPDVSLLGYNYEIINGGAATTESGTSASAPAFAAMVSLVNAARLRVGKGPIGFLNIILYQSYASWANDITVGSNGCSAGDLSIGASNPPNCCTGLGFVAAAGWDPVTGLGSVNFNNFSTYLVGLPSSGGVHFFCILSLMYII